jgi:hypothetical protein
MLKGLKYKLNTDILINLYKTMIRPVIEYADCVWDGCSAYLSNLTVRIGHYCNREAESNDVGKI